MKIYFEIGNFNLNYLEFKNERNTSQVAMKMVGASTNILGDKINVNFNKALQTGINFSDSNIQLFVNGVQKAITSINYNTANQGLVIKPTVAINASDVVTIAYNGTNIIANDATIQSVFTDKPVQNNVGNILGISGKIEAENFFFNYGLTTETANDTGGTLAINYTDSGDYLDYLVNVGETGNYTIEYRYSAESATSKIKLQLINETTQDIQVVTLSPTGNWQTWNTKSTQALLPAGRYKARITVIDAGFNLNWIKFSLIQPDDDNDNVANINDNCPNTLRAMLLILMAVRCLACLQVTSILKQPERVAGVQITVVLKSHRRPIILMLQQLPAVHRMHSRRRLLYQFTGGSLRSLYHDSHDSDF
ncbi:carbohydrate-binding protein [Flavobacterium sp. 3HN19-14]|uniref:carbohydrate-binding protein n=1 Tax=Flavobacterium sp. 3HN19-14 TaxID=3448133 RepID=UPI003EE39234